MSNDFLDWLEENGMVEDNPPKTHSLAWSVYTVDLATDREFIADIFVRKAVGFEWREEILFVKPNQLWIGRGIFGGAKSTDAPNASARYIRREFLRNKPKLEGLVESLNDRSLQQKYHKFFEDLKKLSDPVDRDRYSDLKKRVSTQLKNDEN